MGYPPIPGGDDDFSELGCVVVGILLAIGAIFVMLLMWGT